LSNLEETRKLFGRIQNLKRQRQVAIEKIEALEAQTFITVCPDEGKAPSQSLLLIHDRQSGIDVGAVSFAMWKAGPRTASRRRFAAFEACKTRQQ